MELFFNPRKNPSSFKMVGFCILDNMILLFVPRRYASSSPESGSCSSRPGSSRQVTEAGRGREGRTPPWPPPWPPASGRPPTSRSL